jgi:LysM repeat protein
MRTTAPEKKHSGENEKSPTATSITVQPKLAIGDVNDPLEQEADSMANKVIGMQEVSPPHHAGESSIQRKCSQCEEEVQRKPLASFIQRKEASAGTVAPDAVSNQSHASKGAGSRMDENTQSFMQSRFSADFSDVKIHTGGEAIQMNRELNAKAFTVGNDIYFNQGQYDPGSSEGKHLLAHELTHTVQQQASSARLVQKAPIADPGGGKSAGGKFDPLTGIYTVAAKDNLSSIASRFGTTVSEIVKNNPDIKDPNSISVGQKIFLPNLILPHDPTGMKHNEISFDDYVKKWEAEKGRPITASEKSELERGCVGISSINTGGDPLNNLQSCFDTFEKGLKFAREKNEAIKKAGNTKKMKVQMFSMRFGSGGKPYAPDATGKVDMSDYDSRLTSGDAWRPDDALGSDYINFDFGYYDVESGMWWHANHVHEPLPGGMGPMKAYVSSLDYYSKPLLDFNKQIFCVTIQTI